MLSDGFKTKKPLRTKPKRLQKNYGGGGSTTHPPLYFVDSIDISSFCKPSIIRKAVDSYASGRSLSEVAQELNIPKSTARMTVLKGGVELRPHPSGRADGTTGTAPYGYTWIFGERVEDKKEQKVIQLMVKHWTSGMSFNAIAKSLNRQKIKPRSAPLWDNGTVRKIILRQQKQSSKLEG